MSGSGQTVMWSRHRGERFQTVPQNRELAAWLTKALNSWAPPVSEPSGGVRPKDCADSHNPLPLHGVKLRFSHSQLLVQPPCLAWTGGDPSGDKTIHPCLTAEKRTCEEVREIHQRR
ncbi:hypothetical protein AAFF_G00047920 [Aldrovandia affinis]|uniref:Uncharacterized protein n=1 Tax=Aldrovandia affinis TaxID=143900 RepID=A0AAD7R1Z9_9TELE|nr:hypothetical protein AAFF_G00047920 [Aldrovandia affinis]